MKVYVDEHELWPFYSITEVDGAPWSTARDIPDELWERYCAAGKAYWTTKQEILDLAGIKDDA